MLLTSKITFSMNMDIISIMPYHGAMCECRNLFSTSPNHRGEKSGHGVTLSLTSNSSGKKFINFNNGFHF